MRLTCPFWVPPQDNGAYVYVDFIDPGLLSGELVSISNIGVFLVHSMDHFSKSIFLLRSSNLPFNVSEGFGVHAGLELSRFVDVGPQMPTTPITTTSGSSISFAHLSPKTKSDIEDMKKNIEELKKVMKDQVVKDLSKDTPKRKDHPPWLARAAGAQAMQELFEKLDNLMGLELLDKANKAAALYYDEDPTVAGLVTAALSCFEGDPPEYYASIVRYSKPNGAGKTVVGSAKAVSLEGAIREAVRDWIKALRSRNATKPVQTPPSENDADSDDELLVDLTKSIEALKKNDPMWFREGDVIGKDLGIGLVGDRIAISSGCSTKVKA